MLLAAWFGIFLKSPFGSRNFGWVCSLRNWYKRSLSLRRYDGFSEWYFNAKWDISEKGGPGRDYKTKYVTVFWGPVLELWKTMHTEAAETPKIWGTSGSTCTVGVRAWKNKMPQTSFSDACNQLVTRGPKHDVICDGCFHDSLTLALKKGSTPVFTMSSKSTFCQEADWWDQKDIFRASPGMGLRNSLKYHEPFQFTALLRHGVSVAAWTVNSPWRAHTVGKIGTQEYTFYASSRIKGICLQIKSLLSSFWLPACKHQGRLFRGMVNAHTVEPKQFSWMRPGLQNVLKREVIVGTR